MKDIAPDGVDDYGNTSALRELPCALGKIGPTIVDHFVCVEDVSAKSDGFFSAGRGDDAASV